MDSEITPLAQAELKNRGLPAGGIRPNLIERLRKVLEMRIVYKWTIGLIRMQPSHQALEEETGNSFSGGGLVRTGSNASLNSVEAANQPIKVLVHLAR